MTIDHNPRGKCYRFRRADKLVQKKSSKSPAPKASTESVYVLWHVHVIDGSESEKLIGVFRSRADAKAAIKRLEIKPGFRETPKGFLIDKYRLNCDSWETGFVYARS